MPPRATLRHVQSSPRTWGCFQPTLSRSSRRPVFPTHVGVFPSQRGHYRENGGLPHARGGVSLGEYVLIDKGGSSPRTWGCFLTAPYRRKFVEVFPTHVGVFLKEVHAIERSISLPHARGGVSITPAVAGFGCKSSPRTWGCFRLSLSGAEQQNVFPTHVGVFLPDGTMAPDNAGLPHARGGVSATYQSGDLYFRSSPRTWGCFSLVNIVSGSVKVFPTHVGVFPSGEAAGQSRLRLPHARGGVSQSARGIRMRIRSSPRTWGCF